MELRQKNSTKYEGGRRATALSIYAARMYGTVATRAKVETWRRCRGCTGWNARRP